MIVLHTVRHKNRKKIHSLIYRIQCLLIYVSNSEIIVSVIAPNMQILLLSIFTIQITSMNIIKFTIFTICQLDVIIKIEQIVNYIFIDIYSQKNVDLFQYSHLMHISNICPNK